MNPYLIEIRLVGRIKHDIINIVKCVNNRFDINMHKMVPHITMVGPFQTTDEQKLIKDFESVCKKTPFINYKINGIDLFSKSGVVYLDVAQNDELEKFRIAICDQLKAYCKLSFWDFQTPFKFHATVATRVDGFVLHDVLKYINSCKPLIYDVPLLRATLLKHGRMLCEFDFQLGRKLEKWERANFMQNRESIVDYYESINEDRKSKPRIFFTSDLHFNDKFVIHNCNRPFSGTDTMNVALLNNWNSEITENDTVYYLGDLAHKYTDEATMNNIVSQLNGKIIFIKGNDDKAGSMLLSAHNEYEIKVGGQKFFLIHDPQYTPDDVIADETVWTIHGHKQNRQLDKYPFINREARTINVSLDVTCYRPVSLDEILATMKSEPKLGERELMALDDRTCMFRTSSKTVNRAIVG